MIFEFESGMESGMESGFGIEKRFNFVFFYFFYGKERKGKIHTGFGGKEGTERCGILVEQSFYEGKGFCIFEFLYFWISVFLISVLLNLCFLYPFSVSSESRFVPLS